jgi:hypothetical protein
VRLPPFSTTTSGAERLAMRRSRRLGRTTEDAGTRTTCLHVVLDLVDVVRRLALDVLDEFHHMHGERLAFTNVTDVDPHVVFERVEEKVSRVIVVGLVVRIVLLKLILDS